MVTKIMPKDRLKEFILERNREQSIEFCSPDNRLWRQQYRALHRTEIAALKCMDGRLNLSVITQTPPGIIQPYRNIGGMFDFGWPYFGELMNDWVDYSVSMGRDCLLLITDHFAKGEKHRGCRGFDYDQEASLAHTLHLKHQAETIYGKRHLVVYPVQITIETDEDALIIRNGSHQLNLAENLNLSTDALHSRLRALFPDMKHEMIGDFVPLLEGNLRHIAEVQKAKRPLIDTEHRERILVIGRGVDWLHVPNIALIIGPYSFNLGEPIATAGKILLDNLDSGRIPSDEGVLLMASAACREMQGHYAEQAKRKAQSMLTFALETIRGSVPQLVPHLQHIAGVTDLETREFIPVNLK
jgi:hypothetical protein